MTTFFVVVCQLTGYVMAVPCSKTITAPQLAELYLERVVGVMGLPHEFFSDHDHIITKEFFTTLCELSGVQQKQSPVYRPRCQWEGRKGGTGGTRQFAEIFRPNWKEELGTVIATGPVDCQ